MKHTIALTLLCAAAMFTASCSSTESATSPTTESRSVTHVYGTTEVPADPQNIVVTDEYAGMNLLAVGIVPTTVFTGYGSTLGQQLLRDAGADIIDVPPTGAAPAEDVLAKTPDLVVFSDSNDDTLYRTLSDTVPVLPTPFGVSWEQSLDFMADAFDRHDKADRVRTMLTGDIDALRQEVGDSKTSLSALMFTFSTLAAASSTAPSTILAAEVGMTGPTEQSAPNTASNGQTWSGLSSELVPTQDADIVVVFDEGLYDAEAVEATPSFGSIPSGHVARVNGDMWAANHPFAIYWVVSDMRALVAGKRTGLGTEATADTIWNEFDSNA